MRHFPRRLHEAWGSLASALNPRMGEDFVIFLPVLTYGSLVRELKFNEESSLKFSTRHKADKYTALILPGYYK